MHKNAQIYKKNAQMHKCTNSQMHKCTNAQMHKCTNAQCALLTKQALQLMGSEQRALIMREADELDVLAVMPYNQRVRLPGDLPVERRSRKKAKERRGSSMAMKLTNGQTGSIEEVSCGRFAKGLGRQILTGWGNWRIAGSKQESGGCWFRIGRCSTIVATSYWSSCRSNSSMRSVSGGSWRCSSRTVVVIGAVVAVIVVAVVLVVVLVVVAVGAFSACDSCRGR